jgi:hypothetical protein
MSRLLGLIAFIILCVSALPLVAQSDAHGKVQAHPMLLRGKVTEINHQRAVLILYIKAPDVNAPGKVPDDFAAQAAVLQDQAERLEHKGKKQQAVKFHHLAAELRRWREVEQTIDANTPLIGVTRRPLARIPKGVRLRMDVSVARPVAVGELPTHVRLIQEPVQISPRVPCAAKALPRGPRDMITCMQLVGDVVHVTPLTIDINGVTVEVSNPRDHFYIQSDMQSLRDLKLNQLIFVRALVRDDLTIDHIRTAIIGEANIPLIMTDDL